MTTALPDTPLPATPKLGAEPRDWILLLKPRVISLVVFTGAVGVVIAPGHTNPVLAVVAIFCIALGAGAAGAINMWYDCDIDAVMKRTSTRPIPAGKIEPGGALGYGVVLAVISVLLMGLATNLMAAGVLAFSIFYYAVIYTMWLKRRTPQNIVIGGGAGAFPAVIGSAAVTGHIDALAMLLFLIVFFWTPPHFWSLALYASGDYQRAKVPMLPVVMGPKFTRVNVLVYSIILAPLAMLPWLLGLSGPLYGAVAGVLSLAFIVHCARVFLDRQDETGRSLTGDAPARAAFKFSILYLFVLFAACAVDHLVCAHG
jgi:protoheme IX farnesyltransferase